MCNPTQAFRNPTLHRSNAALGAPSIQRRDRVGSALSRRASPARHTSRLRATLAAGPVTGKKSSKIPEAFLPSHAHPTDPLTANEAASVTRAPLKQVHRIIDAGLLSGRVETRAGARMISGRALVGLRLAHLTADTLTLGARRRIVGRVLAEPATRSVQENAVTVAVEGIVADINEGLQRLGLAKAMVASDPLTMAGAPCFAGTRIPVHDIADMMANGDTVEALAAAYPQLSVDQIEWAAVYATAYPRRGRPPMKPTWRKAAPKTSKVVAINDLPRET